MPKQRVGLRRELAGAPRTREGFSRTFLLRFICEKHTLSFRYAELDALLAAHGVDPKAAYAAPAGGAAGAGADPYVAVAFPSAACCAEVVSKAILVRDALEVWGEGDDHAACAAAVAAAPAEGAAPFFADDVSWCVHVEGFGYSFSGAEQEARRGFYKDALPFRGRVRLKGADEKKSFVFYRSASRESIFFFPAQNLYSVPLGDDGTNQARLESIRTKLGWESMGARSEDVDDNPASYQPLRR